MKKRTSLLGALILGASLFAAGQASAFPLYLTAASGTISCTPSYNALTSANLAKIGTVAVNLKTLMTVVSNEVFVRSSVQMPKDAQMAYDPYQDVTYLTNKSGFDHDLTGIVSVSLYHIATGFKITNGAISETDAIYVYLGVYGHAPDGSHFEFTLSGRASLQFNVDKNHKGSMTLSLASGADGGTYKSGDDGVSSGGFTFKGTGTPEWSGPFSTWWFYHP